MLGQNEFSGKSVLVTGGAGFIGSHLSDALIAKGAKVSVVDNLSTGRRENLNSQVNFFEHSIDSDKLDETFKTVRPEIVFHLAFNTSAPGSVENPLIERESLMGSVRVFHSAKKYGVKKVMFASSEFIYGNAAPLPTKETEALDPIAPYAISKASAENYLLYYHRFQNLPAVILRFATTYGPRQAWGAMTDYIRKLSRGDQAEIWGDGNKTREYTYVDDIVRATMMSVSIRDDHPYPVFNAGFGKETTLNVLYHTIAKILNKDAKPIYLPDRPGEQMRCLLNCDKIRKELDWNPKVDLEAGLRIKIEDFLKNPC